MSKIFATTANVPRVLLQLLLILLVLLLLLLLLQCVRASLTHSFHALCLCVDVYFVLLCIIFCSLEFIRTFGECTTTDRGRQAGRHYGYIRSDMVFVLDEIQTQLVVNSLHFNVKSTTQTHVQCVYDYRSHNTFRHKQRHFGTRIHAICTHKHTLGVRLASVTVHSIQ